MDNGSTIGMDRFGMEHVLPDERRVRTVVSLLELGYADRMVLSQDAAFYSHITPPSWRAAGSAALADGHDLRGNPPNAAGRRCVLRTRSRRCRGQPAASAGEGRHEGGAAVEPGRIEIGEVPDREPEPGEVRIAVGGVGLCGSDMSVFSGRWEAPPLSVDHGSRGFRCRRRGRAAACSPERLGRTVVVEPNVACFACDQCSRGWTSACADRQSVGMNRPGALAEQLVVPNSFAGRPPTSASRISFA